MDGAGGAGTPELEVRLLGPVEVERGGAPVALGGQKSRALLAVLALERGHVVSVDRIIEALWPGDPPESAGHAVQVYVSQLRKALGPVIATHSPGYALELPPEGVDVHRFERLASEGRAALESGDMASAELALREALALWRGPALADFVYEPFAQAHVARIEELRMCVVEERIEADLALGRHSELVGELEALVVAERLRERPRAQLMLALYRSGRQADALAVYRAARETFAEELGIEPGPALRELESAILRQDESLLVGDSPVAAPGMRFRRLATILSCDVVDSMAIAEALDAERLSSVQRRYFEAVHAAIARHGGTVERYAGDAVIGVFGIPASHEDDALRAARAAFDVLTSIRTLHDEVSREHDVELRVRIGLAAGEVITSETAARDRFVAGKAVGIASRLEREAAPGEIVVGEVVARLIDHAARLEPLGTLAPAAGKEPIEMFRLVRLETAAPAFERRLDARMVGRARELAALRSVLASTRSAGSPHAALVVGAPGVGKSRLAAEFVRRSRGVRALRGRCLAYGDGITYWPLREIVAGAPPSAAREALVAALEADVSPPASEVALLFRRLCAELAREKPLVLVFDDVHWAEPTLLDLLETLVDRGEGPLLVVCLAREELDDQRPPFDSLADRVRVDLDALSASEADVLLDELGGTVLESDQRARIAEAAEGNPFFVEQLLALALEGGLAEGALPPTVQALLAARIDRLGPAERSVLERGAVIGREFTRDDLISLLAPEAVPTAERHLGTLADRGFVRPRGDASFAFRHGLVQDAVYRASPKRLRAELHVRYAERLEEAWAELSELDEFIGYHLERAYRLRTELGETDERVEQLGLHAARRLGEAGVRALKRGDAPAAVRSLVRATSVESISDALAAELLGELGSILRASGELAESVRALDRAIVCARAAGDRVAEARAEMERAYVLVTSESRRSDELLDAVSRAIPLFEAAGEERLLGRAWLLAGWVYGGHRGQSLERLEAAERALTHYRRSTWPIATPAGEIANALYFGPVPVPEAIGRCESLLGTDGLDAFGRANVAAYMGGLVAQSGDFERAHDLLSSATTSHAEFGQRTAAATFSGPVLGEVYLLEGEAVAAVEHLEWVCGELETTRAYGHLASVAGVLAEALFQLDRLDEALDWTETAERHAAADDVDAHVLWMPVRAKLLARSGSIEAASALAGDAVRLAATTDNLNRHARALHDLGQVRTIAGRVDEATLAYGRALDLYEARGNVVAARQMRSLLDDRAPVLQGS